MKSKQGQIGLRIRASRFLDKARARPIEWNLQSLERDLKLVDQRSLELRLDRKTNSDLRSLWDSLVERAQNGAEIDALIREGFAIVREVSQRTISMRPFPVQMLAGLALQRGRIVEMQTGEGKTLVAVLPACLHGIYGRGVHVLTFNDYLAKRDAEWMAPIYNFLGLEVDYITAVSCRSERRRAYRADITYLTAKEAGYDLLRDGLVTHAAERMMRPFSFAIIDEADSILIDEARVPLVLAGSEDFGETVGRKKIAALVDKLEQGSHFTIDDAGRNAYLTDDGQCHVEKLLEIDNLFDEENRDLAAKLNQALRARTLLRRDVDYIVRDGQIKIIDELTGRIAKDRHWPDGLHRAVEAKEGLKLQEQGTVLSSISMQHLIRLYPKLAGMTGTVLPSEEEFEEFYDLRTVVIPTHKACIRVDHPDLLFTHKEAKFEALVMEVSREHRRGRPVLIGTASVEESEEVARRLRLAQISCQVLNARNDEEEAAIIAEAGDLGAVTVSTNMAGRGTDIRLGGRDGKNAAAVAALGGLYVVGTTRFESRRIDYQLRGRSGRQGDPGETRFFISLEDDLMRKFNVEQWIPEPTAKTRSPIDNPNLHDKIALTQRIIEGQNLDIRRTLYNYTSFVERQRQIIGQNRIDVLLGNSPWKLNELSPERFDTLRRSIPESVLQRVEQQVALYHLDRCWSDHLADVADIKEGIHLARLGGKDPLYEFHRLVSECFSQMNQRIENGIIKSFETAKIDSRGIDMAASGLNRPSATWTYLVNDNPFEWLVGISAPGNVGLGVAAGLWGGLFVMREIWRKLIRR